MGLRSYRGHAHWAYYIEADTSILGSPVDQRTRAVSGLQAVRGRGRFYAQLGLAPTERATGERIYRLVRHSQILI